MEEESEAVRTTKNQGGRGLRANVCGERAGGCPLSVCGQRLTRVQRAAPHREPVGDFYLQKNRAWWVRHIRKCRGGLHPSTMAAVWGGLHTCVTDVP